MKKILVPLMALLVLIPSGCGRRTERVKEKFYQISKVVKSDFAPDRRVKIFEAKIEIPENAEKAIVRGSTTEAEAKNVLLSALAENGIEVLDSMVILPDPSLEGKTFGVTSLSVINFRYEPDYASESATQTLLGTPLRILEKRGGWTRAVTPEGYIAWVTSGSIKNMTEEEYNQWKLSEHLIITTYYTLFREAPSPNSAVVMDGVMGGIVRSDGKAGNYHKVILPDGRIAYLPEKDAVKFDNWIAGLNPSPDNIIKTARQFMGFPYMWAGTSSKAMDCSGFTKIVYFLNGIILERDASQQGMTGDSVSIVNGFDSLRTADLLFFGSKATPERKERITHVGIYIGSGEFMHSATSVRINSLLPEAANYYEGSTRLLRARRILSRVDAEEGIVSVKNHPWYFNK
jgi:hypothetical protein